MESGDIRSEKSKEVNDSVIAQNVGGMPRDHESIDDFEHLDPESLSPKDTESKVPDTFVALQQADPFGGVGAIGTEKKSSEGMSENDHEVKTSKSLLDIEDKDESSAKLVNLDFRETKSNDSFLPSDIKEGEKFASGTKDSDFSQFGFDLPVSEKNSGLDLFNRFEGAGNVNNSKLLSQEFMDNERGGMIDESGFKDILDHDTHEVKKPETDFSKEFIDHGDKDFNPALSHIKDDLLDDDSFKDTDSLPEPSKYDDKFKDLPDDTVGKTELGFGDHDQDYTFSSNIPFSDQKGQSNTKETIMPPSKSSSEKGTDAIASYLGGMKSEIENVLSTSTEKKSLSDEVVPSKLTGGIPSESSEEELLLPTITLASLGLDAWFNPDRLHPKVVELVYWRDPKKSGIVFGSVLGVLLSLSYFSLISVVAYLSLAVLAGTVCFRIYKAVLQAVQKTTSDGHPFKEILELDLTLPQDKVRELTDLGVAHINAAASELRRLFLVEDFVDSLKFGVLLWCLTYVGAWFNGMTLIIIAFVGLFTLPKVYENNKAQIDQNIDLVRSKIAELSTKVKATIRVGGKKPEEKKE